MDTKVIGVSIKLALFFLVAVLGYNQLIRGDYYLHRAKQNYIRVLPLQPIRGTIYDCQGATSAYDTSAFNIAVIPYQIKNKKDEVLMILLNNLDATFLF